MDRLEYEVRRDRDRIINPILGSLVVVFAVAQLHPISRSSAWVNATSVSVLLLIAGLFFAQTFYFNERITCLTRGRVAEEALLRELSSLDDEYAVFSNVRLPTWNGDIDALVVGPNSVTVVEAKSLPGILHADGAAVTHEVSHPANIEAIETKARRQAVAVRQHLIQQAAADRIPSPIPGVDYVVSIHGEWQGTPTGATLPPSKVPERLQQQVGYLRRDQRPYVIEVLL